MNGPTHKQLRTLREWLELSQEEMAHVLGVSFCTVNRWENARSYPSGATLEVYIALDRMHTRRMNAGHVLGDLPLVRGERLYRIFHLAYGGKK
jgi:DNA-binding XRE family transcriptional regulator